MNWINQLIEEYQDGKNKLKDTYNNLNESEKDNSDKILINSMLESMEFSLNWMKTGRQPGLEGGIESRSVYQKKLYESMDIIPDITEGLIEEREKLYLDTKQRELLLKLFNTLSDREKQCFILHEAEQLSMSEIGKKLNVSKTTVQSYINRARKKVEEVIT